MFRQSIRNKIAGGYSLALILAIIIGIIGYNNINKLVKDIEWVSHTEDVITISKNVLSHLQDVETGQRGFLITGLDRYLEPYHSGLSAVDEEIDKLLDHTYDNPSQTARILELGTLIKKKTDELGRTINLRRKSGTGFEDALDVVLTDAGKEAMDNIRVMIGDIIKEEENLLSERESNYLSNSKFSKKLIVIVLTFSIVLLFVFSLLISRGITTPLKEMVVVADKVSSGVYDNKVSKITSDELGILGRAINEMNSQLSKLFSENKIKQRHSDGLTEIAKIVQGVTKNTIIANDLCHFVASHLDCQVVTFYIAKEKQLHLSGSYAFNKRKSLANVIDFGEGFVGQTAKEKQIISLVDIPEDYTRISSSIGDSLPKNIVLVPFLYNKTTMGVMEIGSFNEISDDNLNFLKSIIEPIGISINAINEIEKNTILLQELRLQTEELNSQKEELKAINEELEEQSQKLIASEEELKAQQEELKASNEELEEKTNFLENNKDEIEQKNNKLIQARQEIEKKAKDLEISSIYKSEFLANMSHELRTPLNSMLILSRDLANNKNGNLLEDQVESAEIVYNSGNDLLQLINEILDLAKVEAGKMTINLEDVSLIDIRESMMMNFSHIMKEKGLEFNIVIETGVPETIKTDRQRLEQIIKNLMSNAIKFTKTGGVKLNIHMTESDKTNSFDGLEDSKKVAFSIIDSGIGIPENRKREIFEAFQQIDGSISRQYEGTGLGLSISRELAKLLGGKIKVESEESKGSTFTLYLPEVLNVHFEMVSGRRKEDKIKEENLQDQRTQDKVVQVLDDDKNDIANNDKIILVIEDDIHFAKTLRKYSHNNGFKFIHTGDGNKGFEYAREYKPDAIILDINLPGIKGTEILEKLKIEIATRHIPVHMMSVEDKNSDLIKKGAFEYLQKPIKSEQLQNTFKKISTVSGKKVKKLLIIEDDVSLRKGIKKLIGNGDINTVLAGTGKEALEKMKKINFDCVILDLKLPDISGFDILKFIEESKEMSKPPVIIYTGKELTEDELTELQKYSEKVIYKGVKSDERLLDEVSLFLHRVVEDLPENKKEIITNMYDKSKAIKGKKILLVDDDMRNVYAFSKILEESGAEVITATNGKKALDILVKEEKFDLVLMDIMMPVMDGYEAISKIRKNRLLKDLPVIALTAKAMKEDSIKCIAAGANDYISKPVDADKLFSLMRVWLYR